VTSEPGHGTTFCIDLPALVGAAAGEKELVG
jgi:signal transduction histidine kinase